MYEHQTHPLLSRAKFARRVARRDGSRFRIVQAIQFSRLRGNLMLVLGDFFLLGAPAGSSFTRGSPRAGHGEVKK